MIFFAEKKRFLPKLLTTRKKLFFETKKSSIDRFRIAKKKKRSFRKDRIFFGKTTLFACRDRPIRSSSFTNPFSSKCVLTAIFETHIHQKLPHFFSSKTMGFQRNILSVTSGVFAKTPFFSFCGKSVFSKKSESHQTGRKEPLNFHFCGKQQYDSFFLFFEQSVAIILV